MGRKKKTARKSEKSNSTSHKRTRTKPIPMWLSDHVLILFQPLTKTSIQLDLPKISSAYQLYGPGKMLNAILNIYWGPSMN